MVKIADFVKNEKICIYCGSQGTIEWDHFIARSKGGATVVPACQDCNRTKGCKQPMEWLRWVKENHPDKWDLICAHNKRKRNLIAKKVQKIRDEK